MQKNGNVKTKKYTSSYIDVREFRQSDIPPFNILLGGSAGTTL